MRVTHLSRVNTSRTHPHEQPHRPTHLMPSFSSISSYCGSSDASPALCPFSALSRWLYLHTHVCDMCTCVTCARVSAQGDECSTSAARARAHGAHLVAFFRRASLMRLRSSAAKT